MAVVHLRSLEELKHALRKLGYEMEREAAQAMRNAARFGATAVLRTSAQTVPRPKASGTYERSWLTTSLRDGAVLSNTARHAVFPERGRLPGKKPPLDPILEWVYQKRLASRAKATKLQTRKGKRILARTKGALVERARAKAIAFAVQRKIARKGTAGRWVLRRTMPMIAKRVRHEIKLSVRRMSNNPPR